MLCDPDEKRQNELGAYNVRHFLSSHGLLYVWNTQGVGSIDAFLTALKQKLIDCRWQCLDSHIQTSERFLFYKKESKHRMEWNPIYCQI